MRTQFRNVMSLCTKPQVFSLSWSIDGDRRPAWCDGARRTMVTCWRRKSRSSFLSIEQIGQRELKAGDRRYCLSCPASFAVVADDELVMQVVTTFLRPHDVYLSNLHPFYAENAFFPRYTFDKTGWEISTLNLDSNIVKFIGSGNVYFFRGKWIKRIKCLICMLYFELLY